MKKKTTKKTARRAVTAVLCLSVALTGGAAIGLAGYSSLHGGGSYYTVSAADVQTQYGGLDLAAGIRNTTGNSMVDAGSTTNTLIFTFPNVNMAEGSKMEENPIGEGSWKDYLLLHSTVEETGSTYTVNEWIAKGKSFRFAVYGHCFILQFENNSFGGGAEIDRVGFKAGFKLFQGGDTANEDWAFHHKCDVAVESTTFTKDLTLFVNRTTGKYEYYAKSLALTGTASKTSYTAGETFDPTGLSLSVTTPTDETVEVPITAEMYPSAALNAGETSVTITYGGSTVTQAVTVVAPEKTVQSVAIKAGGGLTAKKFSLPSELTVIDGTKIVVTYSDSSTEEKDFALNMLKGAFDANGNPIPGSVNTSAATTTPLDVPFTYTEGGTSADGTIQLTVSEELKPTKLTGVKYGADEKFSGGLAIDFNYIDNADQGVKSLDKIKGMPSLIPGTKLQALVEFKFSEKTGTIKLGNSNFDNCQPAFYGGRFCLRDSQNIPAKLGELEYIIIRAGFIWYDNEADTWPQGNGADTSKYFPIASNYVDHDLYIAYNGGKQVKPIQDLSVNIPEGKTITLAPGESLTDEMLEGITYSAAYLDPAETNPLTGNVTAAMCSKAPDTAGAGTVTVTLQGKTATIPVTVEVPAQKVKSVAADFTLTANKYALPSQIIVPDGAQITVTYEDDSTKKVPFNLEWLGIAGNAVGAIDTSTAGAKDALSFTYTEAGTTVTGTVNFTVNETVQASALDGMNYGVTGMWDGAKHRLLPFKTVGTVNAPIVYNQKGQASLISGKTIGDLVLIKFANEENEIACSALTKDGTVNGFGTTWFLQISDDDITAHGAVEYVHFLPGYMIYTADKDNTTPYYPLKNTEGNYAYFAKDVYLAWTKQTSAEKFGTVYKPVKEIALNVEAGTTLKFVPGQKLTNEALAGVTFTAQYYDTAETPLTAPVTADMCSAVPEAVGAGQITVTYFGKTAKLDITVEAPAKQIVSVTADFALTASKYALPSEFTFPEGAQITVTYDDDTTTKVPFALTMLENAFDKNKNARAGVIDTSTAGDKTVNFVYVDESSVEKTGEITVSVSNAAKPTKLTGIQYGTSAEHSGGLGVNFFYQDGADQGLKSLDNIKNQNSLIPGKSIGDLVLIKFSKKTELVPMSDAGLASNGANLQPAFYAGILEIRGINDNAIKTNYGDVEYVIIKEGFIWYSALQDTWPSENRADPVAAGYYPVASNYVAKDMYLASSNKTLVKPVKNLLVTVPDGTTLLFYPEQKLTNADLAGITYTLEWLDPAETEAATGNVTAAMCSAVPYTTGTSANVTVTINNATAIFPVSVREVSMPESIAVVAKDDAQDFSITYLKYAVEPEFINCVLRVTYKDGTTADKELTPEMITKRPNTRGNKTQGDITISFTQYGKTLTTTFTAKIDQNNVLESNIASVAYGKFSKDNPATKGFYVVYFNWRNGGDQGLKALDAIHLLPSSAPGKFNGQFIQIKFSKKDAPIALLNGDNQYTEEAFSKLQPAFYGGAFVLREADKLEADYGTVEYILFEDGIVWYTAEKDNWAVGNDTDTSGYRPVAKNIFTKKMYASWDDDAKLARPVKELTATPGENFKNNYIKGEELSLDFKLNVTYLGGGSEEITPTREMCGTIAEDGKVIITYRSKTCDLTVTYDGTKEVGGIVIETKGKTKFSFGEGEFDATGYVVKMIVKNVSDGSEFERRDIALADIEISGFNANTIGTANVKFIYAGQQTDVDVEIVNDVPEKHMSIDYISNYDSFETTKLNGLSIHFGFSSELGTVQTRAFRFAAELPNVADKIKINGKLASEWIESGAIECIGFYGDEIYIRCVGTQLQGSKNPTGGFGQYIEGTTELIKTITFLPGFQYYRSTKDFWEDDNWTLGTDVVAVKHGIVKEEITLENVEEGHGWVRQFKQNESKTGLAEDAITISKLPAKTTFKVGEEVTVDALLDGLEMAFKYEDGGEETYIPVMSDIEFDDDITATAGKKTVTVYFKYNDYFTTFEIDVVGGEEGPAGGGLGAGAIAGIVVGVAAAAAGAAALSVVMTKKKKKAKASKDSGEEFHDGEDNK